ncbi:hypothetical protein BK667_10365 [Pseudomonas frederiksbergensis]|nr:hypothetical protein BK667_10365 [Pseudomonas frederiksbergensis]
MVSQFITIQDDLCAFLPRFSIIRSIVDGFCKFFFKCVQSRFGGEVMLKGSEVFEKLSQSQCPRVHIYRGLRVA